MTLNLGQILTIVTFVPQIVKGVQDIFGHNTSGNEKKQAAMDAANAAVSVINSVSQKDLLDNAGTQALLSESIEIGVQMMKLEQRLVAIRDLIAAAHPPATTPTTPDA